MYRYLLIVNKQGQTRFSQYYVPLSISERTALEAEIVRRCISRPLGQCTFVEFRDHRVTYRRYASLYFILGMDTEENELGAHELIHQILLTMDAIFGNVCELDIITKCDIVHFIVDEFVQNGVVCETNKASVIEMTRHYILLDD